MASSKDTLIRDVRDAALAGDATRAVRALLKQLLADPDALASTLVSLTRRDPAV
jgi:hypothetical protein